MVSRFLQVTERLVLCVTQVTDFTSVGYIFNLLCVGMLQNRDKTFNFQIKILLRCLIL